jgi:hypothetical protein
VTVLLKVIGLYIIARSQTAIRAPRVVIAGNLFTERTIRRAIPDLLQILIGYIPEHLWDYLLSPSAGIASIAVPQKITG